MNGKVQGAHGEISTEAHAGKKSFSIIVGIPISLKAKLLPGGNTACRYCNESNQTSARLRTIPDTCAK